MAPLFWSPFTPRYAETCGATRDIGVFSSLGQRCCGHQGAQRAGTASQQHAGLTVFRATKHVTLQAVSQSGAKLGSTGALERQRPPAWPLMPVHITEQQCARARLFAFFLSFPVVPCCLVAVAVVCLQAAIRDSGPFTARTRAVRAPVGRGLTGSAQDRSARWSTLQSVGVSGGASGADPAFKESDGKQGAVVYAVKVSPSKSVDLGGPKSGVNIGQIGDLQIAHE